MISCTFCKRHASEYVDFQIDKDLRTTISQHLSLCSTCQDYFDEIQDIKLTLGSFIDNTVAINTSNKWVGVLQKQAYQMRLNQEKQDLYINKLKDYVRSLKPLALGYSLGLAITSILFMGILFSFKPILNWQQSPYENVSSFSENIQPAYTEPSITSIDSRSLVFSDTLFGSNKNPESLLVVAEVSAEGRATLIQLVGPSNQHVTTTINNALGKSYFQPAKEYGHPVSSKVVLLMEQIYVRG